MIYRKSQHYDTVNALYAPDVVQGCDGFYYLFYTAAKNSIISVAKSNTPAGRYEYFGDIKAKDGHIYGKEQKDFFCFDPSVLVDDNGRIYLYAGRGQPFNEQFGHPVVGCWMAELETDFLQMKTEPVVIMPKDWDVTRASFFEGPSVRHIGDWYYLVYPTSDFTGLNYAMNRYPNHDFAWQGPIHSSSNVGYGDVIILQRQKYEEVCGSLGRF